MSNSVFITLNQEVMTELIRKAERCVHYAAPGVYDWVAEALIEVSNFLGSENVTVIVDPDALVMQVGYGTENGLQRLHEKGIPIRTHPGLRIGVLIADQFAAIFAPPALNVDMFPAVGVPNAISLSGKEAERLRRAMSAIDQETVRENPEVDGGQPADVPAIPVVGETLLRTSELAQLHERLLQHPPVAPDLDRQMRVINSTFQVVRIAFHGAKLSQRRLALRAEDLGIEDSELRRRIGGSFKLFETDVDLLTAGFQKDLEEIKRQYNLKSMGEVGYLVLSRDRADLENALRFFQMNLESAQQELIEKIGKELDYSRDRLREFLGSKLQQAGQDEERLARRLDSIVYRMKFPEAGEVLSDFGCEWYIFNVSAQMIDNDYFAAKVEKFYGQPLEQLIRIEPAVGTKQATQYQLRRGTAAT